MLLAIRGRHFPADPGISNSGRATPGMSGSGLAVSLTIR
jgi:hypothetical protein